MPDVVAQPGYRHDHHCVGDCSHRNVGLPGADGLQQNPLKAQAPQNRRDIGSRISQTAKLSARRQAAHEYARMGCRVLHAIAVAQDRATGERARWVYGQHRNGFTLLGTQKPNFEVFWIELFDICLQRG